MNASAYTPETWGRYARLHASVTTSIQWALFREVAEWLGGEVLDCVQGRPVFAYQPTYSCLIQPVLLYSGASPGVIINDFVLLLRLTNMIGQVLLCCNFRANVHRTVV